MTRFLLLLGLIALPLAGCGGDDASSEDIEDTGESGIFGQLQNMAEAAEEMQAAAERPPAEPVNFRELRETLPEALDGMERTNAEGATQGTMGFTISEAEATYETAEGEAEIDISVMDYGAVPTFGMMGAFAWAATEIDRETSTGYEKTIRMGENKGYREYDTERQSGQFSLFVAERFVVQVDGENVTDDQIEAALRAVDLDALEGMRDSGRPDA
ncbi:MAG: transposase [Bacteroidota bacterium]